MPNSPRTATDAHWLGPGAPSLPRARFTRSSTLRSLHLTMRDGVRIAIDVHLPRGVGGPRRPTIVRQTRYLRSLSPRRAVSALPVGAAFDLYARTRRAFLSAGYAWVDVDVRGTGASFGSWPYPWSEEEIRDGGEIVDWIVRQPWSDGKVGSLGISYDGTCAEMLLVNRHPAVRAVAPLFSLYDVYTDVAFPGGLQLAWFTKAWADHNAALDRDDFPAAIAAVLFVMALSGQASPSPHGLEALLRPLASAPRERFVAGASRALSALFAGARPVDGDRDRSLLALAVREHAGNVDIHAGANKIDFRDQRGISDVRPDGTVDVFSPHRYQSEIAASGAAIYSYSGWRDGAYPHAAVKRFGTIETKGSRLLLGPWPHTGKLRIVPYEAATAPSFDHDAELLAFFDEHLCGLPARGDGRAVHYFTMVEEAWKSADAWPPEADRRTLFLAEGRRLSAVAPRGDAGADDGRYDSSTGTGVRSRWRSLLAIVPGDYPDRSTRDRSLLCYDGDPLERDVEVTGHPQVTIFASWPDASDGALFVYLEDVAEDGRVAYVTEGQLRALHRKLGGGLPSYRTDAPWRTFERADALPPGAGETAELTFDLLPISWLFRRGHRIRVAIAGADADHFVPPMRPGALRVHRCRERASRVVLPVVSG